VCDGASLAELYADPLDGEIATEAFRLGELLKRARAVGRPVPASIDRAAGDLWRWAGHDLTPRGRQLVGPSPWDVALPLEGGHEAGQLF
jgi:hypothetical protein